MQVTTLDPSTPEAQAVIESRRRTGADRFDEVWEGVYHVNSAPRTTHQFLVFELARAFHPLARARGLVTFDGINIGTADNFRIPDVVILREFADAVYVASAALVVEILSPGDDTWVKMPYYAERGVPAQHFSAVAALRPASLRDFDRRIEAIASAPIGWAHLLEAVVAAFDRMREADESALWIGKHRPELAGKTVAYFSAEFGLHRALPIYSGGLGVLAGDYGQLASQGGSMLAQTGFLLPGSRAQESEADVVGQRLMAQAGFDPRAAVELWQNMIAAGGSRPPQWLSTHPDPQSRIAELRARAEQLVPTWQQARAAGRRPACG